MPILKKPQAQNQPKPPPQKFAPGKPAPKPDPTDDIPMKHQGGGGDAFAKRFNTSDTKGKFVPPEPGTYNALITEAQTSREGEGVKETCFFELTITDDLNDMQGKTCRIYFNFSDEEGDEMPGMPFFKSALEMLGSDTELRSWEHLEEIVSTIGATQPWVIIDVKKKGKYTNVFLNSVPENQDNKPSL